AASDTPEMSARKVQELELADYVLACSELQKKILIRKGVREERIFVVPLWVDSELWFPSPKPKQQKGALKVIFAGKISLQKGVPYLLQAFKKLNSEIDLLLVGKVQPAISDLLSQAG